MRGWTIPPRLFWGPWRKAWGEERVNFCHHHGCNRRIFTGTPRPWYSSGDAWLALPQKDPSLIYVRPRSDFPSLVCLLPFPIIFLLSSPSLSPSLSLLFTVSWNQPCYTAPAQQQDEMAQPAPLGWEGPVKESDLTNQMMSLTGEVSQDPEHSSSDHPASPKHPSVTDKLPCILRTSRCISPIFTVLFLLSLLCLFCQKQESVILNSNLNRTNPFFSTKKGCLTE